MISPNPTSDLIEIQSNSIGGLFSIKLRSIEGKEIMSKMTQLPNTLNLSDLENGIYLLELSNDQGFREVKQIIKH